MLSIPEFRRLRQEDHKFEVSLSYVPYLETTSKDQKVFFLYSYRESCTIF